MTLTASAATDPAELAPAFEAARRICRRDARGFYLASFFLPAAKRDAAHAVYALCRMIEEAIDVPEASLRGATGMRDHPAVVSPARPSSLYVIQPQHEESHCDVDSPASRLEMLRDRLDEVYDGRLELPAPAARSEQQHALCALAETVRRYDVPKQYFLDLAEGCGMRLTVRRYETWAELERYCYHAGGVVALTMSCVLGLQHSGAFARAAEMGNAMRLTNILRDVREDCDVGRVYLPQQDMRRFGYTEGELSRGVVNENFRELMRFEIARARQLYRGGAEGLCWLAGDGSRMTASMMAVTHAGILDAIERQNHDVFSRRARLSTPQKLARLPRAWRLARRTHDRPLPDVF